MGQRGKTEPSKGRTSLDSPILPPCCSSPHYIPFKHSDARVLLSLLRSMIVIVTISELTHISNINKSKWLRASSKYHIFYLPSYLCGKHKEATEKGRRHCGTEVSLQSQGTTTKCNGSETSINEKGSSKGFCVLEQCHIL